MAIARVIGVSVGADGTIWCVDSAGFVHKFHEDPWEWKYSPTAKNVKEVAVGRATDVWCRNGKGELFHLQGSAWDGAWQKDNAAKDVTTVSAGADGTVWVGNKRGELYSRLGGEWKKNPHAADAKEVAVGNASNVWYRNGSGKVFDLQGGVWNGRWTQDTQASWVQSISTASDGTVCLSSADPADKDRLYMREGQNQWKKDKSGRAIQVSAGSAQTVFCVDADGIIFRQMGDGWTNYYGPDMSNFYVIEEGDTLGSIVKDRYGLSGAALNAKVDEIAALNGIVDKDEIKAGEGLILN